MCEWTSGAVLWRLLHLLVWPLELHMHSAYTWALFSQWEGCVPQWEGIVNPHVLSILFRQGTYPSHSEKQKCVNEHLALFWGGCLRLLHLFVWLNVVSWYTSVFCSPETVDICDGKQVFLSIYIQCWRLIKQTFKVIPWSCEVPNDTFQQPTKCHFSTPCSKSLQLQFIFKCL